MRARRTGRERPGPAAPQRQTSADASTTQRSTFSLRHTALGSAPPRELIERRLQRRARRARQVRPPGVPALLGRGEGVVVEVVGGDEELRLAAIGLGEDDGQGAVDVGAALEAALVPGLAREGREGEV